MKNGWGEKRLGDVVTRLTNGYVGPTRNIYHVSGVPYLLARHVRDNQLAFDGKTFISEEFNRKIKKSMLKAGDVLLVQSGHIGHSAVVTDEHVGHNCHAMIVISPVNDALTGPFLSLFFNTSEMQRRFEGIRSGSTVPHLTCGEVKELKIPIPPLPEQRRIVGILDEAFDGIATAKANAEKNLQNARILFESHLQAVFTQRGEGWVEKRLGDVCAITSTLVDPRKSEYLDLTHVGAGNIESKTGAFVELKTAREEGLISGKFLFDQSMVLYSKIRPYLRKVARPDFSGLCSADMYPLSPLPNQIHRDYLFYMLLSKSFTDYAVRGSARAGMPKVNREHLFEFRASLPSVKKQKDLAENLDSIHEETHRLESLYQRKLASLDELKKSLLHRAFSGQL